MSEAGYPGLKNDQTVGEQLLALKRFNKAGKLIEEVVAAYRPGQPPFGPTIIECPGVVSIGEVQADGTFNVKFKVSAKTILAEDKPKPDAIDGLRNQYEAAIKMRDEALARGDYATFGVAWQIITGVKAQADAAGVDISFWYKPFGTLAGK